MSKEFLKCPNCKSPNIEAGHFESELDGGWRTVTCSACKFQWLEVFELISNWDINSEFQIDENGEAI